MKRLESLLIVEDDPFELESYLFLANKAGYRSFGVGSFEEAQSFLESKKVEVLLTDIFLKEQNFHPYGLDLVEFARKNYAQIIPLIMSSHPNKELYQDAMNKGALFALKKPLINSDEIDIAIRSAKEKKVLRFLKSKEEISLSPHLQHLCEDGLCLESQTRKWVQIASETPELPIVIYGETGTGKEEVAKLIAKHRKKKEGEIPFLAVNCALLDENLAHSTLFGHKKGSFSGACTNTQGYVGEADGGILFLDEIHTLSLSCQQKLLRVLNDGSYTRLGETKELYSKFQVIVASTVDLDDAVDSERFLLDLRIRLTGCDIYLKPLRERISDLPLFVELFFAKQGIEVPTEELSRIIDKCKEYYWQGNIRQLIQSLKALTAISKADGSGPLAENLPLLKSMLAPNQRKSS